jgi:hypothetical protein
VCLLTVLASINGQCQRCVPMKGVSLACGLLIGLLCGLNGRLDTTRNISQTLPANYEMVYHPVQQGGLKTMEGLPTCILRHWVHSHEEDTADIKVYRPVSYNFPPSRGRRGFEFRTGGELIYYRIAPADGTLEAVGRWTFEEPNRVRIDVEDDRIAPFTLEIVSCDDETLKVRQ